MSSESKESSNGFDVFWGEIAPCEHMVQIYTGMDVFLQSLEGFAGDGLQAGDGVIAIAMPAHLSALQQRLTARGFNLESARARGQYITLDAEQALSRFMVKGWPDETLFEQFVAELLSRAGKGRRVRAFGEMVAVLWAAGRNGATMQLERLWHNLCQKNGLSLFCAYPKSGFTQDTEDSIRQICETHSRVI